MKIAASTHQWSSVVVVVAFSSVLHGTNMIKELKSHKAIFYIILLVFND
jgi:hypothetical protein